MIFKNDWLIFKNDFQEWLIDFQEWLSDFQEWLSDFQEWVSDFQEWLIDFQEWLSDFHEWLSDFQEWLIDFQEWFLRMKRSYPNGWARNAKHLVVNRIENRGEGGRDPDISKGIHDRLYCLYQRLTWRIEEREAVRRNIGKVKTTTSEHVALRQNAEIKHHFRGFFQRLQILDWIFITLWRFERRLDFRV